MGGVREGFSSTFIPRQTLPRRDSVGLMVHTRRNRLYICTSFAISHPPTVLGLTRRVESVVRVC